MKSILRIGTAPLFFGALMICVSCNREQPVAPPAAISESAVTEAVAKTRLESKQRIAALEQTIRDLEIRLQEQDQTAQSAGDALKKQLAGKETETLSAKAETEQILKILRLYQYNDLITPPRSKTADVFPLRISNINYIFAEGQPGQKGKLRFSIRNLSKTEKIAAVSAGAESKNVKLASGADEFMELTSAMGQPIKVEVNRMSKLFKIDQAEASTAPAAGKSPSAQQPRATNGGG